MPFGFFDSENFEMIDGKFVKGDRAVDSAFFRRFVRALADNGVGEGDSLRVVNPSGLAFRWTAGYAFVEGAFFSLAENIGNALEMVPESIYIEAQYARTIYAVLKLDIARRTFDTEWVENPGEDFPTRTSSVYQLVLARITIPANSTTATVEDLRDDPVWCGRTVSEGTVRRLKEELLGLINAVPGVNEVGKRPIVLTATDPGEGSSTTYADGTIIGVF